MVIKIETPIYTISDRTILSYFNGFKKPIVVIEWYRFELISFD